MEDYIICHECGSLKEDCNCEEIIRTVIEELEIDVSIEEVEIDI